MYERRLDYKSILSRSGHAVAHDEERRAFERLGKRAGQKAQVAKFGEPVALGVKSFQGRVGNVAVQAQVDSRLIAVHCECFGSRARARSRMILTVTPGSL